MLTLPINSSSKSSSRNWAGQASCFTTSLSCQSSNCSCSCPSSSRPSQSALASTRAPLSSASNTTKSASAPTWQLHRAIVSTPHIANSVEWAFNASASIHCSPIRNAPGRPWAIRCRVLGGSPSARRRCNAAVIAPKGCWPRPPRANAGTCPPSSTGRINGQVPSPTIKPCSTTAGVRAAIAEACWDIY